jgi:hypothetical protein
MGVFGRRRVFINKQRFERLLISNESMSVSRYNPLSLHVA